MPDAPARDSGNSEILDLVRSRVRTRFALTAERFAQHLVERARAAGIDHDAASWARALRLDDLYLAHACTLGDDQAWAECARVHFAFMRDFAGRFLTAADAAEVADRLAAELWQKGKLARYEGRSRLRTWLGAVVAHAALQTGQTIRRREADRNVDQGAVSRAADRTIGPDEQQSAELLAGITAEAVQALSRDDKLLLLFHYEQRLSLDQIAPILSTSKATLSRRLKRLRDEIRATIDRLAQERYRASSADLRAGVDLGRIELDLSLLLSGLGGVKESREDGV